VHPTRFWKLENDFVEPTDEERAAIARALDVDVPDVWPTPDASTIHHGRLVAGGAR
jgi:lambda repressor-like predicted transcriptional regulator